jgi:hypothetical protein
MQGMHFVLPVHLHGTLAANATFRWKVPFDCILQHISAAASNDSDATLKVGTSSDDDEILAETTIGDSGTPVEKDVDNWATTNPTGRLDKGDIFLVTLDFDGSSGTAGQNVILVFTFSEG